ncbi:MAG: XdhC family protein [Propionibacteriaceae bacterium]
MAIVARLDLAARAATLAAVGTPFVWATVVRAERPTSAKPGDSALVLADGQIDGFVGGDCAESTVRAQALEVLATAEPRLLRITPSPEDVALDDDDGAVTVYNPCLSGGSLDIFLEPAVPLPVVAVFGHAPIATALLRAHRLFGQQVLQLDKPDDPLPPGARAVVVASHGNDEQPVLEAALLADVPYIALVASRRRGPAVLASLEVDERMRSRVRTPAGLDIGARTPPEVALSILAEIVAVLHEPLSDRDDTTRPAPDVTEMVRDPVCGMMVAPVDASPHVETPTGVVYFCGTGCRNAYLDNPLAYAQ